jgi:hypothetical protein
MNWQKIDARQTTTAAARQLSLFTSAIVSRSRKSLFADSMDTGLEHLVSWYETVVSDSNFAGAPSRETLVIRCRTKFHYGLSGFGTLFGASTDQCNTDPQQETLFRSIKRQANDVTGCNPTSVLKKRWTRLGYTTMALEGRKPRYSEAYRTH